MAANDNPNTLLDESKFSANELITLCSCTITLKKATNLVAADFMGASDPYTIVTVAGLTRKSKTVMNSLNPEWNESYTFYTEIPSDISFQMYDFDKVGDDDELGDCKLAVQKMFADPAAETPNGAVFDGAIKLENIKSGQLHVKVVCRRMTPVKTEKLLAITEEQLQAASKKVSDRDDKINNLHSEMKELKSKMAEMQVTYEALDQDFQRKEEELKDFQQKSNQMKKELELEIQTIKGKLDDKDSELKDLVEKLNEAKQQMEDNDLEAEVGKLKKEISQLNTLVDTLKDENAAMQEQPNEKEGLNVGLLEKDSNPMCVCFGVKLM